MKYKIIISVEIVWVLKACLVNVQTKIKTNGDIVNTKNGKCDSSECEKPGW